MNVTATPAPKSTIILDIEVPADQLDRSIREAVRHVAPHACRRLPARQGAAPDAGRVLGIHRDDPARPDPIYDEAREHLFERPRGVVPRKDVDV